MTIEKGRAFLMKIGDGGDPENFSVIGGMRSTSLRLANELVDVTHKGSSGWRELLSGAGIRHMSLGGSGIFTNSDSEQVMQAKALEATLDSYRIIFESGDSFTGRFQMTTLEYAGDYNGERTYNIALESSGPITFAAAE
ncbi:phage tail protein [Emcibacter sp.]|uniref:phage tail protein n=1 Tax=Emcibacter sp. TaxID=1979954 RepID=UPI002AA74FA7|nr:phage tail protein [Emcibacter sp.]